VSRCHEVCIYAYAMIEYRAAQVDIPRSARDALEKVVDFLQVPGRQHSVAYSYYYRQYHDQLPS
jgi:hypothetical protein